MPTPKQTRFHYKRCRKKFYELLEALCDAHMADVINYRPPKLKPSEPELPSVCNAVYEAKRNFETATEYALAESMRRELLLELKGKF